MEVNLIIHVPYSSTYTTCVRTKFCTHKGVCLRSDAVSVQKEILIFLLFHTALLQHFHTFFAFTSKPSKCVYGRNRKRAKNPKMTLRRRKNQPSPWLLLPRVPSRSWLPQRGWSSLRLRGSSMTWPTTRRSSMTSCSVEGSAFTSCVEKSGKATSLQLGWASMPWRKVKNRQLFRMFRPSYSVTVSHRFYVFQTHSCFTHILVFWISV